MLKTRVVNIYKEEYDVKIMRGGKWGNPFVIGKDGNRAEVIEKHAVWIIQQPILINQIQELKGKRLGCCCKPLACHGDVLARLADNS